MTAPSTTETETTYSADEIAESLTGFEEVAVETTFGKEVYDLSPVRTLRALVFVIKTRQGVARKQAYQAAMDMPLGEVSGYSEDGVEEFDPEEPVTPQGKDAA